MKKKSRKLKMQLHSSIISKSHFEEENSTVLYSGKIKFPGLNSRLTEVCLSLHSFIEKNNTEHSYYYFKVCMR
jgi:hypothetical protein